MKQHFKNPETNRFWKEVI